MEKNLRYGALLSIYGALLTDKQSLAMEYYYDEDLSLGEIAENTGISRQGVRDFIKRAEGQLDFFEEQLGILKKTEEISKIEEAAEKIEKTSSDREARLKAREIALLARELLAGYASSARPQRENDDDADRKAEEG